MNYKSTLIISELIKTIRKAFLTFTNELVIPPILNYFTIFSILIALFFAHLNISKDILIHHTRIITLLYVILDPFLLTIINGYIVFAIFYIVFIAPKIKLKNKYGRILTGILLINIILVMIIGLTYILETKALKPYLSIDRPYTVYEHKIIDEFLKNPSVHTSFNQIPFSCKVGSKLQGGEKYVLNHEDSLHLAFDTNHYNDFPYNRIKLDTIKLHEYISFKKNHFIPWLEEIILGYEYKECAIGTSCPSGTIMRQAILIFILILIIYQPKAIKKINTGPRIFILTIVYLLALLSAFSRVYDYRHFIFDELISFTAPALFLLVLFLYLYNRQIKHTDSILSSIPLMIIKFNKKGEVEFCNNQIEKQLGYLAEEFKEINFVDLLDSNGKSQFNKAFHNIINEKYDEINNLSLRIKHKNKRYKEFAISWSRTKYGKLSTIKVLATLRDITIKTTMYNKTLELQKLMSSRRFEKKDLLEYALNAFHEFGFKRGRIYLVDDKLYGLKSFDMNINADFTIEEFTDEYDIKTVHYVKKVLENQKATLFRFNELSENERQEAYDSLNRLNLINKEWLDIPLMLDKETYLIGVDYGRSYNQDIKNDDYIKPIVEQDDKLKEDIASILDTFIKYISEAYKNMLLVTELTGQKNKLEDAQGIILELISKSWDINEQVIQRIKESCFKPDLCYISIYNTEDECLYIKAISDRTDLQKFSKINMLASNGFDAKAFNQKKYIIGNYLENSEEFGDWEKELNIKYSLSYPIKDGSKVCGIITFIRNNCCFTSEEVNGMEQKSELTMLENICNATIKHTLKISSFSNEYIHTISHALNDPLLLLQSELFKESIDTVKLESILQCIRYVLNYVSVSSFKLTHKSVVKDFSKLIEPIILLYKMKRPDLVIEIGEIREDLSFDQTQIIISIMVLIDNAIKYSWTNDECTDLTRRFSPPEIKFTSTKEEFIINVKNWGIPYPDYFPANKFSRRRTRESKNKNPRGKGIGLTLVAQAAENHSGTLIVANYVNPTLFRLTLKQE